MRSPDEPEPYDVLPIVRAYVGMKGNSVGGNLHIALDDGNLDDDSLSWCRGWCDALADRPGSLLATALGWMDVVDRVRVADARGEFYSDPPDQITEADFWAVVEQGPLQGWGGHHEDRMMGREPGERHRPWEDDE